jgi:2,4-dienoyl-CoA reductase-like NADH-dependent reductase (Old Yellow Enzyme family)
MTDGDVEKMNAKLQAATCLGKISGAREPKGLLSPLGLRGLELPNRIVIAPMSQMAGDRNGRAGDWHLVHLGQMALGRPAMIFTEVCAIDPDGRNTYADLGLWNDGQIEGLRRIANFISAEGVIPAIQIGHSGRKASSRRPWDGMMRALDEEDAERGEPPWQTIAPSAIAFESSRPAPRELTGAEIRKLVERFSDATRRAASAGFRAIELHGAHGYLLHQFLSATANQRSDEYGGRLTNRMRFPLEVVEAVRAAWPSEHPLFFRLSVGDGSDPGWTIDDTTAFVHALAARGVDIVDCSSGGIAGSNADIRGRSVPGFQVGLAEQLRSRTNIGLMAVGLIRSPQQADEIISRNIADLVAIGREVLYNPRWPLHAAEMLNVQPAFQCWPIRYGWWLQYRARSLKRPSDQDSP